ncbi:MAG TPA: zinc ribbon domain-containing protein [Candidatus Acidoferrum sp.]|nr:zinc ribbon domain-containing protein [Candidatus Acidoferrum sp.]
MHLGALINRSAARLKRNWRLIVPPILTQVLAPLILTTVAFLVLLPLVVAFGLIGDTFSLIQTAIGGFLVLAIAIFLFDTFVTAGWAYMNKRAVVNGRTELADLWVGAKKYFLRILGGRILVALILALPVAVGTIAAAASVLTLKAWQLTPPEEITPEAIVSLLSPIIFQLLGIVVVIGLIELVLYIFLLPWMQTLVMDDLGIVKSIKSSFFFVRKNSATIIGYIVISGVAWIAASWITSLVWPNFSYSELTNPTEYSNGAHLLELMLRANNIVYYVTSALLSAFFTLLMFVIYADRTRSPEIHASTSGPAVSPASEAAAPPSPPRKPRRGIRYCINCGRPLIMLAVFCPNCGARQPPLPPE